jgi:uncharacterized membrane protein
MGSSDNLKNHVFSYRLIHHPVGAFLGGLASAAICGALGSIHGPVVTVVMATLGVIIGAPFGALIAASSQWDP